MEGGWDYYENGGGTLNAGKNYTITPEGLIQQPIAGSPTGNYAVYNQGANVGDPYKLYDGQGQFLKDGVHKSDNPASLFALAALAAGGMGFGLPALMGGQGGLGGAAGGFIGEGAASGVGAWDGALGGSMLSGGTPAAASGGGFSLGNLFSGSPLSGLGGSGGSGMFDSFGWGDLFKGGMNLAGSMIQGNAAQDAANAYAQTANAAAQNSKFRPVGVTTRFGSSNFGFDANGNLNSAGYSLSPEMAAMQEQLLHKSYGALQDTKDFTRAGQGLFGLGRSYASTSPEQAAADWMSNQQNLLAPTRERQLAAVRNGLFNTGREGLSVGATGARPDGSAGLRAANPEMEAYYNAIAQQDAQLATQADAYGQQRVNFGQGLMNGGIGLIANGYSPFKTALGMAGAVDAMGQEPFTLGMNLGGQASQGGSGATQALLSGAALQNQVNSQSPFGSWLMGGAGSQMLGGLFGNNRPSGPLDITQNPNAWTYG
jgi:hypothetical protein